MKEVARNHYSQSGSAENYHKYWKNKEFPDESLRKGRERFRRFTDALKPDALILDAGCGTGIYHKHFHSSGFGLVGVDSSEEMLNIARRENPYFSYKKMDITRLSFGKNSFDGIWTSGVLLHMAPGQLSAALREFRRVLKGEGALFISTRTGGRNSNKVELSSEGGEIEVFYYTRDTLYSNLENAGFEILWSTVESDDSGRPFNYIHLLSKKT